MVSGGLGMTSWVTRWISRTSLVNPVEIREDPRREADLGEHGEEPVLGIDHLERRAENRDKVVLDVLILSLATGLVVDGRLGPGRRVHRRTPRPCTTTPLRPPGR